MDLQQHDIDADADGEPDAPDTFREGVGFTAARLCPLTIDTTWVLAASWLLLAAGNLGIQYQVHVYLALPSVVLRAAVTVGCALCATEFYDGYMMQIYKYRTILIMHIEEALLLALGFAFRTPRDENEDRPRRERIEQLWQRGTWQAAPVLHAVLTDVLARICEGLIMVAHAAFWWPPDLMPWTYDESPLLLRPFLFVLYFVWYWMALWVVMQNVKNYLPHTVLSVLDWVARVVHWPARSALRVRLMPEAALWYVHKVVTATIVGCLTATFLWARSLHVSAHAAHAWDASVQMLNAVIQRDGMVLNYLVPDATDFYPAAAQLGIQVSLQAAVAALCYALMVMYRLMLDYQLQVNFRQRELGLRVPPVHRVGLGDRFSAAWYRAVAVNLMTFTAYQLFFFARSALGTAAYLDSRVLIGTPWRILFFCQNDNWRIYGYMVAESLLVSLVTALALYFTHVLLRWYTWVIFCLLVYTEVFDLLVYWYTDIVTVFTATLKHGVYPFVFLDFRMANKPLIAHALMAFLFKPEGPLLIVSPNENAVPFDPEGWWE